MYARVARWEGGDGEAMLANAKGVEERAADGPPPGVPAKGLRMLLDRENGQMLSIVLFETEADLRQGDETLRGMDPPGDGDLGRRVSVEHYELVVSLDLP